MKSVDAAELQVLQVKPRVAGSRVGTIVAMHSGPIVDFSGNPLGPQRARVVASLAGRMLVAACEARLPVLLVFEDDDPARPVIVDVIIEHPCGPTSVEDLPARVEPALLQPPAESAAVPSTFAYPAGARVAAIAGIQNDVVLVDSGGAGPPAPARSAVVLRNLKDPVVVLGLADGSMVIIGQLHGHVAVEGAGADGADVVLKGQRVRIEADTELTLVAGACTVTLDARGKTTTTADQIVSRARGANRVQGGSVQLN